MSSDQILAQLLPPGVVWDRQNDPMLYALLAAAGEQIDRIDARIDIVFNELIGQAPKELIEEWEQIAGIPDVTFRDLVDSTDGGSVAKRTLQERLRDLQIRVFGRHTATRAGITALSATFGEPIVIATDTPHAVQYNLHSDGSIPFRCESQCGDRLGALRQNDQLRRVLEAITPYHASVKFGEILQVPTGFTNIAQSLSIAQVYSSGVYDANISDVTTLIIELASTLDSTTTAAIDTGNRGHDAGGRNADINEYWEVVFRTNSHRIDQVQAYGGSGGGGIGRMVLYSHESSTATAASDGWVSRGSVDYDADHWKFSKIGSINTYTLPMAIDLDVPVFAPSMKIRFQRTGKQFGPSSYLFFSVLKIFGAL